MPSLCRRKAHGSKVDGTCAPIGASEGKMPSPQGADGAVVTRKLHDVRAGVGGPILALVNPFRGNRPMDRIVVYHNPG